MFDFIVNIFKIFLTIIIIGIPVSIVVTWLLFEYLFFCSNVAGFGGIFIGFFFLISVIFAALISY